MRQFITAICAALVAGCSFGVTFAPKEYVDSMDATNRDFVIEYVNAEVANLVRKENLGYITATNRAMTAIQQHQSLESVSNYTDFVIGSYSATNTLRRFGTETYWQDQTGCVWEVSKQFGEWSVTNITTAQLDEDFEWYGPTWETESDGWYITDVPGWYISATTFTPELISKDFGLTEYRYEWSVYAETESIPVTSIFSRSVTVSTNLVGRVVLTSDLPDPSASVTHETVTNIVRDISRGGIWDNQLGVWWTPIMQNGALKYVATTNVDLTAEIEQ